MKKINIFKGLSQLNKSEKEKMKPNQSGSYHYPEKLRQMHFIFHARGMTLDQQSVCIPANNKHALWH